MDDSRKDAPDFDLSARVAQDEESLQLSPSDLNPSVTSESTPSVDDPKKPEQAPTRPMHSALDAQLFNALVSPKAPITLTRQPGADKPDTPVESDLLQALEPSAQPEIVEDVRPKVIRFESAFELASEPVPAEPEQQPKVEAEIDEPPPVLRLGPATADPEPVTADDWEPLPPEVLLAEQMAVGHMSVAQDDVTSTSMDDAEAGDVESDIAEAEEAIRPVELEPVVSRDFSFPFSAEPIVAPGIVDSKDAPEEDEAELVAEVELPREQESFVADDVQSEIEPESANDEPEGVPLVVETKPDPEVEPVLPQGRTGAWWTIPLMCLGLAIVACAVLVPASDENRRATHELAKIEQDVEYFQKQSEVNKEFLDRVSTDPTLAERLAMRQLRMTRADSRVVQMPRKSDPFSMSPYALVSVTPPEPLPEYRSVSGFLTEYFLNTKGQIYFAGLGLLLTAAGVICGGEDEPDPQIAPAD